MSRTLVLGIESSCDDTAAAVVADGREALSSVVRSQVEEHAAWGGVVPEVAGRGHLRDLVPTVERALAEADVAPADLDAVAVTLRPGLLGSLLLGATTAKALAWAWDLPLVGVDHVRAHAWSALVGAEDVRPPCIALVASGGHTSLYRVDSALEHRRLGATRDDAAGEALDKAAAMLGLGYPGGPVVQEVGAAGDPKAFPFKLPLLEPDSLDFSFSGLKTALLYTLHGPGGKRGDAWRVPRERLADLCASFEAAIAETLTRKCIRAAEREGLDTVVVGGGVACNARLRRTLADAGERAGLRVRFPPPAWCTDNAVMIAALGHELWRAGEVVGLDAPVLARGE